MSGQGRDQIVIQDENPQFIEKPQSAVVDPFDHIVVGLERKKQREEKIGKWTEPKDTPPEKEAQQR